MFWKVVNIKGPNVSNVRYRDVSIVRYRDYDRTVKSTENDEK